MVIVFLLEEISTKYLLDGILPRLIPDGVSFVTISHEGKADLQKSIPDKLRGWNIPNSHFVIIQDQDSNDCRVLKRRIRDLCDECGKTALIRIACHEMESWYFGDLDAVSKAYGRDLISLKGKRKYRNPDAMESPKRELRRLIPEHEQISGAKKIAPYMDLDNNTSVSFNMLIEGIRRMLRELQVDDACDELYGEEDENI